MRLVHEPDETIGDEGSRPDARVLATDVEVAESTLTQALGLMFRSGVPDEYALVLDVDGSGGLFSFGDGPPRQFVHMLCMRFPIDVLWLADDEVVAKKRLRPWRGMGVARADTIVELPAGAADAVSPGDTVRREA